MVRQIFTINCLSACLETKYPKLMKISKEIQRKKNYSSFMQQSINWTAKKENINQFSVSVKISEIELPDLRTIDSKIDSIIIKRTFDVSSMSETLSITDCASKVELFDDEMIR